MKGQGSTEYLVILAVVLVVALVVIGLLGQFTEFGTSGLEQQSKSYWHSATPISIQNIKVSGTSVEIEVKNQLAQRLNLTNASFDGVDLGITNTVLAAGQTAVLNGTLSSFTCTIGQPYEFLNVTFTYNQGTLSGMRQVGSKPLYGRCS